MTHAQVVAQRGPRYDAAMNAVRFRVTGRVQGVGFRAFTRGIAARAGVVGWCRNTADGAVEGEACGEPAALDSFLAVLAEGPPSSRVGEVQSSHIEPFSASSFQILR